MADLSDSIANKKANLLRKILQYFDSNSYCILFVQRDK